MQSPAVSISCGGFQMVVKLAWQRVLSLLLAFTCMSGTGTIHSHQVHAACLHLMWPAQTG